SNIPLAPDRLRIWIQSGTVTPGDQVPNVNESSEVGVAVAWVQVQPVWNCNASGCDWRSLFTLPPVNPILLFMLLTISAFIVLSAFGLSLERTQWVVITIIVFGGLGLGFARILMTQYLPALTVAVGAFAVTAGISRYAYTKR